MSLETARYGKDLVRVLRVVRSGDDAASAVHDVAEYNVRALVEGDIAVRYGGSGHTAFVQYVGLTTLVS